MKLVCIATLALAGSVANAQLWNNGSVLGGDLGNPLNSVIDTGGTTFGAGNQANFGNTVADDFVAALPWNVTGLSFFAYQTAAGGAPFTFTGASFQITNSHADPLALTSTTVSNGGLVGYRVTATTLTNRDRTIYRVDITGLNINLAAGNYVVRWGLTGSIASGPWAPYIPGSRGTGNAQQSLSSLAYAPLLDQAAGVELPFIIDGTVVPTPASLALLGLGGLVAGRRRR